MRTYIDLRVAKIKMSSNKKEQSEKFIQLFGSNELITIAFETNNEFEKWA